VAPNWKLEVDDNDVVLLLLAPNWKLGVDETELEILLVFLLLLPKLNDDDPPLPKLLLVLPKLNEILLLLSVVFFIPNPIELLLLLPKDEAFVFILLFPKPLLLINPELLLLVVLLPKVKPVLLLFEPNPLELLLLPKAGVKLLLLLLLLLPKVLPKPILLLLLLLLLLILLLFPKVGVEVLPKLILLLLLLPNDVLFPVFPNEKPELLLLLPKDGAEVLLPKEGADVLLPKDEVDAFILLFPKTLLLELPKVGVEDIPKPVFVEVVGVLLNPPIFGVMLFIVLLLLFPENEKVDDWLLVDEPNEMGFNVDVPLVLFAEPNAVEDVLTVLEVEAPNPVLIAGVLEEVVVVDVALKLPNEKVGALVAVVAVDVAEVLLIDDVKLMVGAVEADLVVPKLIVPFDVSVAELPNVVLVLAVVAAKVVVVVVVVVVEVVVVGFPNVNVVKGLEVRVVDAALPNVNLGTPVLVEFSFEAFIVLAVTVVTFEVVVVVVVEVVVVSVVSVFFSSVLVFPKVKVGFEVELLDLTIFDRFSVVLLTEVESDEVDVAALLLLNEKAGVNDDCDVEFFPREKPEDEVLSFETPNFIVSPVVAGLVSKEKDGAFEPIKVLSLSVEVDNEEVLVSNENAGAEGFSFSKTCFSSLVLFVAAKVNPTVLDGFSFWFFFSSTLFPNVKEGLAFAVKDFLSVESTLNCRSEGWEWMLINERFLAEGSSFFSVSNVFGVPKLNVGAFIFLDSLAFSVLLTVVVLLLLLLPKLNLKPFPLPDSFLSSIFFSFFSSAILELKVNTGLSGFSTDSPSSNGLLNLFLSSESNFLCLISKLFTELVELALSLSLFNESKNGFSGKLLTFSIILTFFSFCIWSIWITFLSLALSLGVDNGIRFVDNEDNGVVKSLSSLDFILFDVGVDGIWIFWGSY